MIISLFCDCLFFIGLQTAAMGITARTRQKSNKSTERSGAVSRGEARSGGEREREREEQQHNKNKKKLIFLIFFLLS